MRNSPSLALHKWLVTVSTNTFLHWRPREVSVFFHSAWSCHQSTVPCLSDQNCCELVITSLFCKHTIDVSEPYTALSYDCHILFNINFPVCLQLQYWHYPIGLGVTCRRCYINFIKKVNSKRGSEGLEETKKAFDFMLNYVGKYQVLLWSVDRR